MKKKLKYDFELKFKFFYLQGVIPPSNFSPKMDIRVGHDPNFYGIKILFYFCFFITNF